MAVVTKSIEKTAQEIILESFLSGLIEKRTIEGICKERGIRNPEEIERYRQQAKEIAGNGVILYEGRLKVLSEDRNGYYSLKEASKLRKIMHYLGRIIRI
ncbi:hypothetical protein HYX15_01440 [Candidatus Woesearchaeota archaeon]|nr:hypothetical protein [Candidatus Woesearchaeota archaeon]